MVIAAWQPPLIEAHVFNVEMHNGHAWFIEPQQGRTMPDLYDYAPLGDEWFLMWTDDLVPTEGAAGRVQAAGSPSP